MVIKRCSLILNGVGLDHWHLRTATSRYEQCIHRYHHQYCCTLVIQYPMPGLDWIVQCFTSPPTQYRLYGRRFLQMPEFRNLVYWLLGSMFDIIRPSLVSGMSLSNHH